MTDSANTIPEDGGFRTTYLPAANAASRGDFTKERNVGIDGRKTLCRLRNIGNRTLMQRAVSDVTKQSSRRTRPQNTESGCSLPFAFERTPDWFQMALLMLLPQLK